MLELATIANTKDKLTEIIANAVSWAIDRGLSHREIAAILIAEFSELDESVSVVDYFDMQTFIEIVEG